MGERRVLVVGGGIAGLSFAVAARRAGMRVDVAELESKVVGVGIFLTGSTLRALDSIGVAHRCADEGWPVPSIYLYDGAGNFVGDSPLPKVAADDLPISAGIRRPALARVLSDAAEAAGADIRLGLTVDEIAQDADGVSVLFSDGRRGRYDILVGADGIYSHVRRLVFESGLKPFPVGQGGWRFMTPRHPDVDRLMLYSQGSQKAGFIPLDKDWMYVLCTSPDPDKAWIDPLQAPTIFREVLEGFEAPLIQEMRERLLTADPAMVWWRPFESLLLEDGWSNGRVVVIGDAAHSMTPHLTSGGGMAIEDAVILATHLADDRPVEQALQTFYDQRIERVRTIQNISLEICREEISANPSRDKIFGLTTQGYDALAAPFMDNVSVPAQAA